jgi:DNA-binding SARP family transcriptional activator
LEFRILGPLEIDDDEGRRIPLGASRQRAILAILLTRANEVVSADRLIDDLWGERPPRTARNTLHYHVSQLRKALGADRIVTRPPGYLARVDAGELDLERFTELLGQGGVERLREALGLWRGPPLADLAYEPFAQAEIGRLEELRLTALEERVEADLELGRHAQLVAELEALIDRHPLRERLRGQLMLALYRSGRQAEALEAYREARRYLVAEIGIEPGPVLQELERAVLRHDCALDLPGGPKPAAPGRAVLLALRDESRLDALTSLAEPLARQPPRELLLTALIGDEARLGAMTRLLHERRAELLSRGVSVRAAALTSDEPALDLVRLAARQEVDLILIAGAADAVDEGTLDTDLEALATAPCDVGLLVGTGEPSPGADRPVLVPFGGAEHEWAAVEVAAWIASAHGAELRLLGSAAGNDRRDASALLATASLLVQRAAGIPTEPILAERGADAVVSAAEAAGLVVIGLSDRWRQEGLGAARLAIVRRARPPSLLVRRGLRPGGLAPAESLTRFTWSLP